MLQSQLRLQHKEKLVLAETTFRIADQSECVSYWRSLSHWCSASSDAVKLRSEPRIVSQMQGLALHPARHFFGRRLSIASNTGWKLACSSSRHAFSENQFNNSLRCNDSLPLPPAVLQQ
ncbi:hypothetical protein [Paraburkholderia sp. SOS3]|uniref:hypothetical protein n=1 Tax=Paraburkholderia sp. SOS3 TaxID=1926494 RepID=UPI0018DE6A02|nr:hypothetical protein [Paraburkholderia sp. SOS3]